MSENNPRGQASDVTVKIVCGARGCNRVLKVVDRFPADEAVWIDVDRGVHVESCLRHGGIPHTISDADARRADRGLPAVDRSRLIHWVPWANLRLAYRSAAASPRRVATFPLLPLGSV